MLWSMAASNTDQATSEADYTGQRFFDLPKYDDLNKEQQNNPNLISCHAGEDGQGGDFVIAATTAVTLEARCAIFDRLESIVNRDIFFSTENTQVRTWPFATQGVLQFWIGHFGSDYSTTELPLASEVCARLEEKDTAAPTNR